MGSYLRCIDIGSRCHWLRLINTLFCRVFHYYIVLLYEFDSLCMLQMYDSMMSICFRCLGRLKGQRFCSKCRGSNYELCTDLDGFANPYRPMGDTGKSIYISPVAGVILAQSWFLFKKKGNKPGYDMDIT